MSDTKTKEEYVVEFIKALKAVEDEMEPYMEHRRDLKKSYVEDGRLSKDEMRFAVKAYRMMKSGDCFDEFSAIYGKLAKSMGVG
tara:strand:+ start:202 stop:453 length:252 start_codon:yes stop_codon:yes gene_type:complete